MLVILSLVSCLLTLNFDLAHSSTPRKVALLIIDMQDCFVSGGSLEVKGGDLLVPVINQIRSKYKDKLSLVALAQDFHPPGHVSFASRFPTQGSNVTLEYSATGSLCQAAGQSVQPGSMSAQCSKRTRTLTQALWPDHCVQNVTSGPTSSAFIDRLVVEDDDVIVPKGTDPNLDAYSAFFDNGGFGQTSLDGILTRNNITDVIVTGLAADYCVYYTALDAKKLGYETYYVMDAVKPVAQSSYDAAIQVLDQKGVHLVTTKLLDGTFSTDAANCLQGVSLLVTSALVSFVHLLL